MTTWQEAARQALEDAYPGTVSPAGIGEAIKKAGVIAWSREGLSRWLKVQVDEGRLEHPAFKQYRVRRQVREGAALSEEAMAEIGERLDRAVAERDAAPGRHAAPQVGAHLREDPDRGGLVVQVHVQHPNSKGAPYERHVPNVEAALGYIGTFWRHSAPGRDAAAPPASGVEWGYRYRLLNHPLGGRLGRVTERSSASRAEAEEDVAAFLEEPAKWEAEVVWRTAEVKPGEWHSLRLTATDHLDKVSAADEDGEELSPQVLFDLLSLAGGTVILPEVIATWAPRERAEAARWAAAEHLSASDNPVKRLPKPTLVKRAEAICGSPAMAQLAVEAWPAFKEGGEFTAGWEDVYAVAQDAMTGLLALFLASKPGRA